MRFRPHRGMFVNSLAEMCTVHSIEELEIAMNKDGVVPVHFLRFDIGPFDNREGWNAPTYYVIAKATTGETFVAGMADADRF